MPASRRIGSYTVLRELARGGMARVHLARFVAPGGFARLVAIKQAHPGVRQEHEQRAMLIDEARLASRAVHANIVNTLDVLSEGEDVFVVMEYVHGESLASLLRACSERKERLPVAVAAAVVADVLRGLHAAHEAKDEAGVPLALVHRDVSPQNVLVDVSGIAKVCDFGIARAHGRLQATAEGVLKGKVAYMAPEQIHGDASRLSDLFSAGVVLWEALTTERLFRGESRGAILASVLGQRIEPPSSKNADVPKALDAVVLRALDRRPERRFADAAEMCRAIEDAVTLAKPTEIAATVVRLGGDALAEREREVASLEAAAASEDATLVQPSREAPRDRPAARRRTLPLALLGAAVLVVAVLLAAGRMRSPRGGAAAAAPPPASASAGDLASATEPGPPTGETPEADPSSSPVRAGGPLRRPAARPGCVPPYTIDSAGRKVYKRTCFGLTGP